MLIDRARIAELIPHSGSMCLLDGVLAWDAATIVCSASSHRDRHNPLATDGRLDAACAIEYAAQAMAVHGALTRLVGARPQAGLLVGVRDVSLSGATLDACAAELRIDAEQLSASPAGVMYRFKVHADGHEFASGRATVVLDSAGRAA